MKKLDKLLASIPKDAVVLDSWLRQQDISKSLKQKYVQSGWLKYIGKGASYRINDSPNWQNAVLALQEQGMPLHLGGKSVLEIAGLSHFVTPNLQAINLFGNKGSRLPQWFMQYDWKVKIIYSQSTFLDPDIGLSQLNIGGFKEALASTPERAILEMLSQVHKEQSIEECYYIMENLANIDTDILQLLLENCNSIKVNRLFLYLAKRCGHIWYKNIDQTRIDIGTGNRQIIAGGYLEDHFKITIPRDWKENEKPIF